MSEILKSAISEFLDCLPNERHFDMPLMALLRLHGFTDIHFLHGATEFGKDFIAKRIDGKAAHQYLFQSKAGSLAKREWREVQHQCEEMALQDIGHPAFDKELPRKLVVVITGRLAGQAPIAAEQYAESLTLAARLRCVAQRVAEEARGPTQGERR